MPDNKIPKPSFKDAFEKRMKQSSQKNDPLFEKQDTFAELFQRAIDETKDPNTAAKYIEDRVKRDYTTGTSTYDTLTERDAGIVPGSDQNEVRAWNQSVAEKWKFGIAKGIITGVGSVAESTLGVVDGILEATVGGKGIEGLYNNAVGQGVDYLNNWAQENMPNYYRKAEEEMGLLERLGTANFWSDKFLNGAGYFAGAYVSGLGLSKVFQVGKFAATGTKLYETAGGLNQALKVGTGLRIADAGKQLAIAAMMAQGESATEARAIQNTVREQLEREGNHTPEEIDDLAQAAGNVGYGINLVITGGTDLLQFGKVISGGYKRSKKELNNIITSPEGVLSVGKTMSKPLSRALSIGKGTIPEVVQEGGQFATESGTTEYYMRKFDPDSAFDLDNALSSFVHGLEKTFGTTDGLESMFLGALLGGIGSTSSSRGEYNAKKERTENLVGLLNNFNSAINKKDSAIRGLSYMKDAEVALERGDIFAYKNAEYNQFKSYIQDVLDNGGYDLLIDKLDTLKGLEEEEFKDMFGFDPTQPLEKPKEQIIEDAKSKIKDINKIYEDINLRFPNINKAVKDVLFDASTSASHLDKREREVSGEIGKLTSEALLTQKYYNWANDKFNNNTVFKELEKDGEVQKDERGRFIELESQGKKISYEEFRRKAIEEYREEYNKKLDEVKSQMNPLDAQNLTELTTDLNRIADLREQYIKIYNKAITAEEQIKIINKAEKAKKDIKNKLDKEAEKSVEEREKEIKLKESKDKLDKTKDKAKSIKESEKKSDSPPNLTKEDLDALDALNALSNNPPIKKENDPLNPEMAERDIPEGVLTIGGESTSPQENKLTKEEEVLLESDKTLNITYTDGEVEDITKQEVDEETTSIQESLHPVDNKGYIVSPNGVIESLQRLIVPAASAISYLQREYKRRVSEESGYYEYNDLTNELNPEMSEPMILSHFEYQVGEKLTLEVDKTFNIAIENKGIINYEFLLNRERQEGKENLLIPIAVKNKNGKILGYLHDIDYIIEGKVASKNNNLERQREELSRLRNLIVSTGKVNVEINSKGFGTLARNAELTENKKPKKRKTSEAFPDPTLRFSIGKQDGFYVGKGEKLILPEGATLINNNDTPIVNGSVYSILPTTNNNKYLAVRLDTSKLNKEFVDTIVSVIEANIDKNENIKNQIGKHEGINIFTQDGLREFIGKFTLVNKFTTEEISDVKNTKKFFDISNNNIKFVNEAGTVLIIKDRNSFNKNKEELIDLLNNKYTGIYLSHLRENKPFNYSIISNGQVENRTSERYTDFIKDNTETNLNSFKLSEDEYSYFVQPVITFKVNDQNKSNVVKQETFSLLSPQENVRSTIDTKNTKTSTVNLKGQTISINVTNEDDVDYLPSSSLIEEINNKYKNCF